MSSRLAAQSEAERSLAARELARGSIPGIYLFSHRGLYQIKTGHYPERVGGRTARTSCCGGVWRAGVRPARAVPAGRAAGVG